MSLFHKIISKDLDFVLNCICNVFGEAALKQLMFIVTFWDLDAKSKKERRKRKITPTYLENMIQAKVDHVFREFDYIPKHFLKT